MGKASMRSSFGSFKNSSSVNSFKHKTQSFKYLMNVDHKKKNKETHLSLDRKSNEIKSEEISDK